MPAPGVQRCNQVRQLHPATATVSSGLPEGTLKGHASLATAEVHPSVNLCCLPHPQATLVTSGRGESARAAPGTQTAVVEGAE